MLGAMKMEDEFYNPRGRRPLNPKLFRLIGDVRKHKVASLNGCCYRGLMMKCL